MSTIGTVLGKVWGEGVPVWILYGKLKSRKLKWFVQGSGKSYLQD